MLGGAGPCDYAQVGFGREPGQNNEKRFTEWSLNCTGNWERTLYPGFSAGDAEAYLVEYSFTDGKVRMYRNDGGDLLETSPSVDGHWGTGWTGQFQGETFDAGDNIPGNSTNKTSFTQRTVRECHGCNYVDPSSYDLNSNLAVYKKAWTNEPKAFDIWTDRS